MAGQSGNDLSHLASFNSGRQAVSGGLRGSGMMRGSGPTGMRGPMGGAAEQGRTNRGGFGDMPGGFEADTASSWSRGAAPATAASQGPSAADGARSWSRGAAPATAPAQAPSAADGARSWGRGAAPPAATADTGSRWGRGGGDAKPSGGDAGGAYVPPSMRGGAGAGPSMGNRRRLGSRDGGSPKMRPQPAPSGKFAHLAAEVQPRRQDGPPARTSGGRFAGLADEVEGDAFDRGNRRDGLPRDNAAFTGGRPGVGMVGAQLRAERQEMNDGGGAFQSMNARRAQRVGARPGMEAFGGGRPGMEAFGGGRPGMEAFGGRGGNTRGPDMAAFGDRRGGGGRFQGFQGPSGASAPVAMQEENKARKEAARSRAEAAAKADSKAQAAEAASAAAATRPKTIEENLALAAKEGEHEAAGTLTVHAEKQLGDMVLDVRNDAPKRFVDRMLELAASVELDYKQKLLEMIVTRTIASDGRGDRRRLADALTAMVKLPRKKRKSDPQQPAHVSPQDFAQTVEAVLPNDPEQAEEALERVAEALQKVISGNGLGKDQIYSARLREALTKAGVRGIKTPSDDGEAAAAAAGGGAAAAAASRPTAAAVAAEVVATGKVGPALAAECAAKFPSCEADDAEVAGALMAAVLVRVVEQGKLAPDAAWATKGQFGDALAAYCFEKEAASMEAIFALQRVWHEQGHPKMVMAGTFIKLYDDDVIEEAAFRAWKDDIVAKVPGKTKAIFDTNAWFNWLDQEDEEEESDEEDEEEELPGVVRPDNHGKRTF